MALIKQASDGAVLGAAPLSEIDDWLAEMGVEAADVRIEATVDDLRLAARTKIAASVGDQGTLVGTALDGVHLLLHEVGRMAAAIQAAPNLAAMKAAAAPLAEALAPLVAGVDDESIALPYAVKPGGRAGALAEIAARATKTAAVFAADDE